MERVAFANACRGGTAAQVRDCIVIDGADPNKSFHKKGATPLMVACKHNKNHSVVRVLLDHGADPSATSFNGASAIHVAAQFATLEVVTMLKCDANATSKNGVTPLMCAVLHDDPHESVRIMWYLLECIGVDANRKQRVHGFTALMYAARFADASLVSLLLQHGAAVNATDDAGETALMHACRNVTHCVENVKCLLAAGADTSIRRLAGETALHFAYAVSPKLMRLIGGPKDALRNTPPNVACSDPLACTSYAVARFGLKANPEWAAHNVEKKYNVTNVWSAMRSGVQPDYNALFTALVSTPCEDARAWHWIGYEMQSRQEGSARETLLHVACRSPVSSVALPALMRLGINPHLHDNKGRRALDVCVDPEARAMVRAYMTWRPTIQHTRWLGPIFERRARTFLLVCLRLGDRVRPPRDILHLIIRHLAEYEFADVH